MDKASWGREDKVADTLDAASSREPVENLLPKHEVPTDSARQTGDSAVYKYYIESAGWVAVIGFVVSMAVFAFCDSFPSKRTTSLRLKGYANKELFRSVAEMVGRGQH